MGQLLNEMDGIESRGRQGGAVFMIACTNRIGDIDEGFLRPGRLGILHVGSYNISYIYNPTRKYIR